MRHGRSAAALALASAVALGAAGCATAQQGRGAGAANALTAGERAAGWRLLFDGRTTAGWRGYMQDGMPAGWQAVDGALTRVAAAADVVTQEQFGDFELSLEWKVRPGERANSGIFFRAVEGPPRIHHSAPEMQVLDDETHPDGRAELTSAGSNFALHPAPRGAARPAGEWNAVRLLVRGARVEHWLNGRRVVAYELWSPEWERLIATSKFKQWPQYGRARRGHVGLQEHGSWVAFRNVKIREIQ